MRVFCYGGEECGGDYGSLFCEVVRMWIVYLEFFVCVWEGVVGCVGIG